MLRRFSLTLLLLVFVLTNRSTSLAIPGVGTAPAETDASTTESLEEILDEVNILFKQGHPLDARSKLLKATEIAPEDYRPFMLLGAYYLSEVAHFRLAYRHLKTAEQLFEKRYGTDRANLTDRSAWQQQARLLYLLAEAELNLDRYQASLDTLDRFGKYYWDTWYPGTRAWVLMKLKRVDEAVRVAQWGLFEGADQARTFNILGILLSLKGNREDSLTAFSQAIRAELRLGSLGQAGTPLNNSGEVYRELFSDDLAEASWLKALQMPDGCDHILPSLNLAILYGDQLRFFQAERVLADFRACFSANSLRSDTEHRGLLALAEGRLAMRTGDPVSAVQMLNAALEREQWFGKIGTNENDLRFAATVTMAQALEAQAAVLSDRATESVLERARSLVLAPWSRIRAWWYKRRAREVALDELSDFEDMFVRNTDTMLEYPTLGVAATGFPVRAFERRTREMLKTDSRKEAAPFYQLYLGTNLLAHGKTDSAIKTIRSAFASFRAIDRLARAESLARLALALEQKHAGWFHFPTSEEKLELIRTKEELFLNLPSHVRNYDLRLPVAVARPADDKALSSQAEEVLDELISGRFEQAPDEFSPTVRFVLSVREDRTGDTISDILPITVSLKRGGEDSAIAEIAGDVSANGEGRAKLVNQFIDRVFRHRVDPPPAPLPKLSMFSE